MFEDVEETKSDDPQDDKLHFYYNREERIKKAPQIVKDYYSGKMRPVRGFRVLFNKQNRFIFLALVFFVGATWIYTGLNKTRAYSNIAGINFELIAFEYDEEIYTSIQMKRSKNSKDLSPKTVYADIFVIDPNNQVGDKKTLTEVYKDGEQFIRTKFTDFDIIRVDVILSVDGEEKELSAQVTR